MQEEGTRRGSAVVLFGIAVSFIGCILAFSEYLAGNVSATQHIVAYTACAWLITLLVKVVHATKR